MNCPSLGGTVHSAVYCVLHSTGPIVILQWQCEIQFSHTTHTVLKEHVSRHMLFRGSVRLTLLKLWVCLGYCLEVVYQGVQVVG